MGSNPPTILLHGGRDLHEVGWVARIYVKIGVPLLTFVAGWWVNDGNYQMASYLYDLIN